MGPPAISSIYPKVVELVQVGVVWEGVELVWEGVKLEKRAMRKRNLGNKGAWGAGRTSRVAVYVGKVSVRCKGGWWF
jgi:hypothetical protein